MEWNGQERLDSDMRASVRNICGNQELIPDPVVVSKAHVAYIHHKDN